ncbi:hypothetical protein JL722_3430 [Aureococcus anophagefferens]|nr:hypothetical protein JL722_3430 [Aureococcus anophagefferens]
MSYAYFHRDGKGAWHGYDAKTNAAIEAARPLEATLTLRYPDNPEKYRTFEIRFGAKAVSRRLKSPPSSGIIQVNVADENTRVGLGGGKHRKASVRASKRGGDCVFLDAVYRAPNLVLGPAPGVVVVAARHKEAFGKKKLIAGLEIPVDILEPNVDTTGWLPMQKGGGKIQLRLRWLRGFSRAATATAAAAPAVVTGGPVAAPPPPPPPVAVPPPPSGAPVLNAGRVALKDADDRVLAPPPPPAGGLGLMGAIAARLAERRGSIAMTPMDESDSDSDGDWD